MKLKNMTKDELIANLVESRRQNSSNRTESLKQGRKHLQALNRFETIFFNNLAAMAVARLADHTLVDVNPAWERMTDYNRKDVLGQNIVELGIANQNSPNNQARWHEMDTNGFSSGEYDYITKTGEHRIAVCSMAIIDGSEEQQYLATFIDVTDQRRMEQKMSRFDRLDLIGEMAAGIGHEVRNPLTIVRGYLQLFQGKKKYVEHREYFDTMIEELDRANTIITEFLSLAKDKTVELKRGNVNTLLTALFPLLQADAFCRDHNIQLEIGAIPDIAMNVNEMRQMVLNLVRNGLEAMTKKGTVSIKTYLEDNKVVLAIKDEGPGIPEKVLEKLGTPFITTKDNGTGLGLPVCYRIAQRHNAQIDVMTFPEGTTFFVKFNI